MKILYGKKTILMPFAASDVPEWIRLLENEGYLMGQSYYDGFEDYLMNTFRFIQSGLYRVWTVYTKNLNSNKKIGFICVYDINPNMKASMLGIMDKEVAKGLPQRLKTEKLTYAEDSLRALIEHLFTDDWNFHRLEAYCFKSNKPPRKLAEKVGFKKEGELREYGELKGKYENVIAYGLLKEEYKHNG